MSFNTEKNVPEVKFIADSTKRATGLYGPEALSEDITEIVKMFDPESTHSDNITPGGISKDNLREELRGLIENAVQKIEGFGLSECNYSRDDSDTLEECAVAKHTHGYDEKPTAMSNNLLTSGAIHNVVNDIAAKIQIILESYSKKEETEEALSNYVKKEDGKSLSRNDYTDSDKQNLDENTQARHTHTYDEAPTKDSNNSITSGGVYSYIQSEKQTLTRVLGTGVEYKAGESAFGWNPFTGIVDIFMCELDHKLTNDMFKDENVFFQYWSSLGGINALSAIQDGNGNDIGETYVKKSEFKGYNSLSYFFANNYNNDLLGTVETSGALFADYIFKQNSMTEITVDLSNCYSMVGGFLNSEAETVIFENGTPKLTKAQNLFRGCKNLKNVTGLILTSVDSCKYMFYGCESLTEMSELIISGDCSYMFYGCTNLTNVALNCLGITYGTGMFTGCTALSDITIKGKPDFETIFNSLENVENGTIKVDDVSSISDDVKSIATEKGWKIA